MQIVSTVFAGRPVSRYTDIICPSFWPDLAEPHYFLTVYVKSNIYETRPANIDDLKQGIRESIQGIPEEMLQRVMTSSLFWLQECIERYGRYLESVIFKHW
jgi:hypothetical protein